MGTLSLLRALCLNFRRPRRRRRIGAASVLDVLEARQMLAAVAEPFEQHFDFGTSFSPLAADHTRISQSTVYTQANGFGWTQGTIHSRDRGASHGDERVRDFNITELGTFAVDVPLGVYEVSVTMGDGLALRDEMGVFLEGTQVDSVTAAAGVYETRTFTVTVTDGQLTLLLDDLGGANTVVMINALDVVQISGDLSGPQIVNTSPNNEAFDSLDRITLSFNEEIDETTFGTDDVTLIGPNGPITPTAVNPLSADSFEVLFDAQTVFGDYTLSVGPDIADSDGNLMNQDGDDVNGELGEDGHTVTINLLATPEFEQTFDFGTISSPLASGATRVSEASTYSATDGFGWTEGSIASRDRGALAGDDLTRDFNVMTSGTFVVDVLAEEAIYDVTVILGDAVAARDEVGLFLEGTLQDTVTSAAGTYETRTFRVTVSDGQLTLRLEDLGGTDAVAVINSLRVRHVETVVVEEDPKEEEEQEKRRKCRKKWKKIRRRWRKIKRRYCAANPPACQPPRHGHNGHQHHHHHGDGEHPFLKRVRRHWRAKRR